MPGEWDLSEDERTNMMKLSRQVYIETHPQTATEIKSRESEKFEEFQRLRNQFDKRIMDEFMMRAMPPMYVNPLNYKPTTLPDWFQYQPPPPINPYYFPEGKTMKNYSTAVFLINSAVRALTASYEPEDGQRDSSTLSKANAKYNSVRTYKTMDQSIKKGDLLVVPTDTRWGFTVVRVEDVDVEVDYDGQHEVKWIVGKLDYTEFKATKEMEDEAIAKIKKAENRKRREDLARDLMGNAADDLSNLDMARAISAPASPVGDKTIIQGQPGDVPEAPAGDVPPA